MTLATLCLSVAANVQIYVRSAANAREAWENLEKHFEKSHSLRRCITDVNCIPQDWRRGLACFEHVNYMQTLSDHLEAVGDPIVEKDLLIILISSLTEEYNHLITALETLAEDRLTLSYVRDRVIHEYEKLHNGSDGTMNPSKLENALFTRRNESKSTDSIGKKCFCCQKEGHFARKCYKTKADRKLKQKGESANTIELEAESEEFALTTVDRQCTSDEWWIDSGVSQHMSNDRISMVNYVSLHSPRSIQLADNSILLAYGKGDVKVYVCNGPKKICLVLKEVMFVPDIKKKLLSLSTVAERRAAVKFNKIACEL